MKSSTYRSRLLRFLVLLIAPFAALAADLHDSLVPVKPDFSPGPEYADETCSAGLGATG